MQKRQKLCPHFSITGSLKKSRQIAHVSSFFRSSPAAPAVAMFTSRQQHNTAAAGRGGREEATFVLRHLRLNQSDSLSLTHIHAHTLIPWRYYGELSFVTKGTPSPHSGTDVTVSPQHTHTPLIPFKTCKLLTLSTLTMSYWWNHQQHTS